jgi:hypothetical protein
LYIKMVAIGTVFPGCSYAAGTFTIPISALNATLATDWNTSTDSFERLLYALTAGLRQLNQDGTLTQPACFAEVSNSSVSQSLWETGTNVFEQKTLQNFVVSFVSSEAMPSDPDTISAA